MRTEAISAGFTHLEKSAEGKLRRIDGTGHDAVGGDIEFFGFFSDRLRNLGT
jgi:hypothetical protein